MAAAAGAAKDQTNDGRHEPSDGRNPSGRRDQAAVRTDAWRWGAGASWMRRPPRGRAP